jgi:hypothetical protein
MLLVGASVVRLNSLLQYIDDTGSQVLPTREAKQGFPVLTVDRKPAFVDAWEKQ